MVLHVLRKLIISIICFIMLIGTMPAAAFAEAMSESGSEPAPSNTQAVEVAGEQASSQTEGQNGGQASSQTEGQDGDQASSQPACQAAGLDGKTPEEKNDEKSVTFSLVGIDAANNSVTWIENRSESVSKDMTLESLLKTVLKETGGKCEISEEGIINEITGPSDYGLQGNTLEKTNQWQWDIEINSTKLDDKTNIKNTDISEGDKIKICYSSVSMAVSALEVPQISTFATEDEVAFAYGNTKDKLLASYSGDVWNFEYSFDVLGLARAGYFTQEQKDAFFNSVKGELESNGTANTIGSQSSDNSKTIIALTAAGKDPTNVGGYNLLEPLANYSYVAAQGNNGPLWALMAFDCGGYTIPQAASSSQQVTRERLIDAILESQHQDGGWSYSGSASDIDMTGMMLQGLAPYYQTNDKVKVAVDKGLMWLSSQQNSKGLFTTGTESSESQSQVIVALTSLGIDPAIDTRFVKNGKSAIDALLTFYVPGGGYKHVSTNWKANDLATAQGNYAITSYYRFLDGANKLYQMSDNNSGYVIGTKYNHDTDTPKEPTNPDTNITDPANSAMGKATGSTKSLGLLKLSASQLAKLKELNETKEKSLLKNNRENPNKKISNIDDDMSGAMPWIIGAAIALLIIAVLLVWRRKLMSREE